MSSARRGDRKALGFLIAAPAAVFGVPAALGYPLLTGDDVIQNYPLRVLAGEILRHGHLPVYDPLAWGGTPLLASGNGTVAFPDIVLFAFLPALLAWVLVEAIAFAGAACGLYVFLRCRGLGPLPAALGGAAYGLGGYVSSQAVHLDVVQTAAALAWVLVGIERVVSGPARHRPAWTALLAAAVASAGLSGNPESTFYAALGAAIYLVVIVASAPDRWRRLGYLFLGAVAGGLVAALQVIPETRFVGVSQRAAVSLSYLVQGSLRPSALALLALPHLFGGGPIGVRPYLGRSNLAEIDAYPGLLALAGASALIFSWRRRPFSRVGVWYLIGAVGLLIALGTSTPLPHLLHHLPVIGSSRIPARALLLVSLALSVLFAEWSAAWLTDDAAAVSRRGRYGAIAAPAVVLCLVAAAAIGGRTVAAAMAGRTLGRWTGGAVAPYLAVSAAVALLVILLVHFGRRLSTRQRGLALLAVFVVDLLLFTANQSSLAPIRASELGRPNRDEAALRAVIGPDGRYLIYDPSRSGRFVLDQVGAPNLDVFFGLASAQGYGSLAWDPYARQTGTHLQDALYPPALRTSVFDSLDVQALLAPVGAFRGPVSSVPVGLSQTTSTTRYFGGSVEVASLCVGSPAAGSATALLALAKRTRLLGASAGATSESRAPCGVDLSWARPIPAKGVLIPPAQAGIRAVTLDFTTAHGTRFSPDGPLSAFATPPHWVLGGTIGPYVVLRDRRAAGPLTVLSSHANTPQAASVRVLSSSEWTTTERIVVNAARPVVVVRDVADIPGWSATLVHHGRTTTLTPTRRGLVQQIAIPAGRTVVTFSYDPPGLALGEDLAVAGIGVMALLLFTDVVRRRRRGALDRAPPATLPLVGAGTAGRAG